MLYNIEEIIRAIRLGAYSEFAVPIARRLIAIDGIEVTQAIQYYKSDRHLTDASDRQPDNSVRLVANKPAWVRVHLTTFFAMGNVTGITGTLDLQRMETFPFMYTTLATLTPQPPGTAIAAGPAVSYDTRRGSLAYSLNFIIPANQMCGRLHLVANITGPHGTSDTMALDIDVTLRQTLRVAGIRVGYNGPANSTPGAPNLTIAAPTMNDLATTTAWTLTTFPVQSTAVYRNAGTITWNLPLTDAPSCDGCCTPNWVALNTAVQAQRVADGNRTDFLYYGLMANGIPMGAIIGCNTGGVSTGGVNNGITMAHELGHACGFAHGPCGTTSGDPNYPAYEPHDPANMPTASIGEYGLNINDGAILPPTTFKDVMAYCGPRWISLYNYRRLINHTALDPVFTCMPRHPWWQNWEEYVHVWPPEKWLPDPPPFKRVNPEFIVNPEPLISIIGVVQSENEIEIHSLMRLSTVPQVSNGQRTELTAHLIGENGRSVARGLLYRLRSHAQGCGCGCDDSGGDEPTYPYVFQAFVPDKEPGAALRITSGEREIWERKRSDEAPRIGGLEVYITQEGDKEGYSLVLASPAESSSEHGLTRWYQWSDDDGQNWYALTTGITEDKALVDAGSMPEGVILVRALVSDGFLTTVSDPVSVEMPRRTPEAAILAPREGARLEAGSTMRLWAAASIEGEKGEENVSWLIDGEQVANGLDVFIAVPQPGEHRLTLIVRGDAGETYVEQTFLSLIVEQGPE